MAKSSSKPNLLIAFTPIIFLVALLFINVKVFDDTLGGANQIILLLSASIAGFIAMYYKVDWHKISDAIVNNIGKAMPAMLILLLIGSLAGTWLLSGIVPAMVYYGLKIINPTIFLFTAIVISAVVSFATGSSWSTIATIGVALLGIGKTLGFSEGLTAGAIISGAYFGDKMSPLSDTTNLAPAVAGSDLFTHIRYMLVTTLPSISIAAIIFLVVGFTTDLQTSQMEIQNVITALEDKFVITPFLLVVPIILIVIIIKKTPAIPSLFIGSLLGGIAAIIFQPGLIQSMCNDGISTAMGYYKVVMTAMFGNIHIESSNAAISELFSTSGMRGMLDTVWLILSAMVFGGAMEAGGLLQVITSRIVSMARSTGSLIFTTIVSSIFLNFTASDQYISIVIPGKMFAESYRKRKLKPELLSRTLEDGGTITSVLIPWNTCGATQSKVLGVATADYIPYCFFNILNPVIAIIMGYVGFKIRKEK